MKIVFAVAIAVLGANGVFASTLSDTYSSFFVFGDSLSDPGNTPLGRFTDGEVWADPLTDQFDTPGTTANFAVGGGRAIGTEANDLDAQLALFDFSVGLGALTLGNRPLAAIWFGGNDVFSILPGSDELVDPAAAALRIVSAVNDLYSNYGIQDFLLFDLPNQGQTPLAQLFGAEELISARSDVFNSTLDAALAGLDPDIRDRRVGVATLFEQVVADPSAFGLLNITAPCHPDPSTTAERSTCTTPGLEGASATLFGFNDPIHPNSVLHAEISKAAEATALAPIPLPATAPFLIVAFGGVVALRRRKATVF